MKIIELFKDQETHKIDWFKIVIIGIASFFIILGVFGK